MASSKATTLRATTPGIDKPELDVSTQATTETADRMTTGEIMRTTEEDTTLGIKEDTTTPEATTKKPTKAGDQTTIDTTGKLTSKLTVTEKYVATPKKPVTSEDSSAAPTLAAQPQTSEPVATPKLTELEGS